MSKTLFFAIVFFFFWSLEADAQEKNDNSIAWLSFEQLEDSLSRREVYTEPVEVRKQKRIFIYFYADWCEYCKKMDRVAFQDSKIIKLLNRDFYAVKMNAESEDFISFDGQVFYNEEIGKKRNPTHQLALLFASRNEIPFTLPAMIVLDENFKVVNRYFEYLTADKLIEVLTKE